MYLLFLFLVRGFPHITEDLANPLLILAQFLE